MRTRTYSHFLVIRAQKTTKMATELKTRNERWPHGAYLTVRSSLRSLICDILKIAQANLIGLHGAQFLCPHARSYLRKPVCAGKSAVKFALVDGPLRVIKVF